jgi:hypothetical protein
MTAAEVDARLRGERTCRVATVGAGGWPHVSALWFVWDGAAVWLNSLVASRRWADVVHRPRVSLLVDGGVGLGELWGVEVIGVARAVGEVPRTRRPDPALTVAERLFAEKYACGDVVADGRHGWLRVAPDKITSWDFRGVGRADAPA